MTALIENELALNFMYFDLITNIANINTFC